MKEICFFYTYLDCFTASPMAALLAIPSVDTLIWSDVVNFAFWDPVLEASIFFLQPGAGLTKQVLVRDSQASAPLQKVWKVLKNETWENATFQK